MNLSIPRVARSAGIIAGVLVVVVTIVLVATQADASSSHPVRSCHATWYGAPGEIPKNWPTASGQPFNPNAMKAASNELPFFTRVRVTYKGRSVVVTTNDHGGFHRPVCLDLTIGAFRKIANLDLGNIVVRYQVL